MLELKTPKERAKDAHIMAQSFSLVRYRSTTYIPADFETGDSSTEPDPDRKMWLPMTREDVRRLAAQQFNLLFASDGELNGFDFMVAQNCPQEDIPATSLLVRTTEGLRRLDDAGKLTYVTGDFVPNTLTPMLNEDEDVKKEVFDTISGWLNSDDEAESLLSHLATSLAPGWSAVKYVMLLGEGRNGKSVLLKMVSKLFGQTNVSNVTRQAIAEKSPAVLDLNGKLVNLVFDGQSEYLKDSGAEKTLIAGEPYPIRRLYESTATLVQTTALFVEGLNKEPKSNDKSSALQKRLVRFEFQNIYPLDHAFERKMLSDKMLGAFLSLLVDRYVLENEVAQRLAPTKRAVALQLEHMYTNSMAMQFIRHVEETDTLGATGLLGEPLSKLVQAFQSWRIQENDLGGWAEPDVVAQLQPLIHTDRKTQRVDGKPRKVRFVTGFKEEATAFLDSLTGEENADDTAALVED